MSTDRGHVLYVAWGFPPAKSGGVFRMMETANVLSEQGWRVTVLACDIDDLRRYAGVDLSTLDGVDPAVTVVRVPMELGPFETDLHRWSEDRVEDPDGWFARYQKRVDAGFPNSIYGLWEAPLQAAATAVHEERPVDVVVASGGPFVCFSIGDRFRRDHGVPFVVDYRDSWSLQQFTDERLHEEGSPVHQAEGRILSAASEVWFVNDPMRQWHEEVYPQIVGKTRIVTNGYDSDSLAGLSLPVPHTGPVRFGYLGTLTSAVPLTETLDGYRSARRQDDAVRDSTFEIFGYLGFYPTPHPGIHAEIQRAAADGVTWRGALPKSQVGTAYAQMDALVLSFGGTRYVTSGKVFEYMATARPIVSVHAPENAVREVLDGYPLWFQAASLDPADVASAFIAAAQCVRSGRAHDRLVLEQCLSHARQFERRRCLRPAVQALAEWVPFVRDTAPVSEADSDVVAFVGAVAPAGLGEAVARAGRRLVLVPSAAADAGTDGPPLSARIHRVALAEPGTAEGRLRRLYALLDDSVDPAVVTLAERLVASGCGAVWGVQERDLPAVRLLARVLPGLSFEMAQESQSPSLGRLLAAAPPTRMRESQEPVENTESTGDTESTDSTDSTEATPPRGGAVVLSSSRVGRGSRALLLAAEVAADRGEEVLLLAPAGGRQRETDPSRTDSTIGRVRIIRLPVPADPEAGRPASWRDRGGAWRQRRITVQAPVSLRVANVQYSKRLRERTGPDARRVDPALVALTRLGTGAFRVLDAADRAVDAAGRRVSDAHDRLDAVRHGAPDWQELFPEGRRVSEALAPMVDRLEWDTLHVADPGMLDLARAAVERRRAQGRAAQWFWHSDGPEAVAADDQVPVRVQLAHRKLVSTTPASVRAPAPEPIADAIADATADGPSEEPWTRAALPAWIGIGAYNMAGQGWAWAKAIESAAPGVTTEVVTIDRGSHLMYDSDIVVPLQTFTEDEAWMRAFEDHVLDSWTHALIEGGRAILGSRRGRNYITDARIMRDAGIEVGLLFHGSDLRDPRLHASRTPWSPFTGPADELVTSLQARRDVMAPHFLEFGGPAWVSTPDLLADLPGAQWLPVVVDPARWVGRVTPLERSLPVVVHAPSRARMKGTDQIEDALRDLRNEGLIDYRRIEGIAPSRMPLVIGTADIVLDQFALGSYGVAAVEAMASGRVVLGHVMSEVREHCPGLPIVEATPATIDGVLRALLADGERAREIARAGPEYVSRVHDGRRSGQLLVDALKPSVTGDSRGRLRGRP